MRTASPAIPIRVSFRANIEPSNEAPPDGDDDDEYQQNAHARSPMGSSARRRRAAMSRAKGTHVSPARRASGDVGGGAVRHGSGRRTSAGGRAALASRPSTPTERRVVAVRDYDVRTGHRLRERCSSREAPATAGALVSSTVRPRVTRRSTASSRRSGDASSVVIAYRRRRLDGHRARRPPESPGPTLKRSPSAVPIRTSGQGARTAGRRHLRRSTRRGRRTLRSGRWV
jgi:hypothetical protein